MHACLECLMTLQLFSTTEAPMARKVLAVSCLGLLHSRQGESAQSEPTSEFCFKRGYPGFRVQGLGLGLGFDLGLGFRVQGLGFRV